MATHLRAAERHLPYGITECSAKPQNVLQTQVAG